ncbi:MAG: S-adenosylmethionine decarboxylase [Candidatus Woesearchaeota archaeon]
MDTEFEEQKSYSYDRTVHLRMSGCRNLYEDSLEDIINACVFLSNADERERIIHKFSPQGVSSSSILSESHLNFHISPEEHERYAQIDISTCGRHTTPTKIVRFLMASFIPREAKLKYEYLGFDYIEDIFPKNENDFLDEMFEKRYHFDFEGKHLVYIWSYYSANFPMREFERYLVYEVSELKNLNDQNLREFYVHFKFLRMQPIYS